MPLNNTKPGHGPKDNTMSKKTNNTTVKELATAFFGKRFSSTSEEDRKLWAHRFITPSIATEGHVIFVDRSAPMDYTCDKDYHDSDSLEAVLTPYIDRDTVTVPKSLYGHLEAGYAKHGNIAICGRWCAFYSEVLDEYQNPIGEVEDGARMECDYKLTVLRFDSHDVQRIMKKFKVQAVRVTPTREKQAVIAFDVKYKGKEFEIYLLKCRETDDSEKAMNVVGNWAEEEKVYKPYAVAV